ncbi:MAG: 50S ribosomal protein L6, partial [Nitrospiraceae bacterium]
MSRVGRKPIPIPAGVDVNVADRTVSVKGPLGRLEWLMERNLSVAVGDGHVQVARSAEDAKVRALHGLARAEINNMIVGVTKGYERTLEITGVGYKAQVQGKSVSLNVGCTHPVVYD